MHAINLADRHVRVRERAPGGHNSQRHCRLWPHRGHLAGAMEKSAWGSWGAGQGPCPAHGGAAANRRRSVDYHAPLPAAPLTSSWPNGYLLPLMLAALQSLFVWAFSGFGGYQMQIVFGDLCERIFSKYFKDEEAGWNYACGIKPLAECKDLNSISNCLFTSVLGFF